MLEKAEELNRNGSSDTVTCENESAKSKSEKSSIYVDFEGPDDPENPLNWSRTYKWTVVAILSAMTLISNVATVICAPATPQILEEFGRTGDGVYANMIVTIWELGEAFGPLFTAPLSEVYGRRKVYNTANCLFIIFAVACALSTNISMLIAFRFLNGSATAAITLNPGIVGDMFPVSERGRSMSLANLAPLLGIPLGPIIGAYLTQAKGWRWAFWLTAIMTGVCEIFVLIVYRESYKLRILQKKARRLGKDGKHPSKLAPEYEVGSGFQFWKQSTVRPLQILIQSPIVLALGLYVAVVYGYLFVVFTGLTEVSENIYGFSQGAAGLTFLGPGLGMIVGVLLNFFTSDWYVKKRAARNHGVTKPEHRLPPMVLGGIIIPVGFFLYGWTAQYHVQWMAPIVGTGLIGFGLILTTVPCVGYLVDAFGMHGSSAVAATSALKCVFGACLPLAAAPLYARLGYGWGNSVLGFIALVFVPVPVFFIKFGEKARKSSRFKVIM